MASISGSEIPEGPVLTVITKRLRALKKKYNRILNLEETLSTGKTLIKEQSDLLNSKPVVAALIDEYEKLRQPLSAAVEEELSKIENKEKKDSPAEVEDLLRLLYFASLFEVKPQSEFTSTMLTRTHERGCCLTYDYVTDDATDLLGERDLDLISVVGGMMVARPVYSGVSHREALEGCVRHAGLWLRNADQPINPECDVTYASLREKLKKIMASDYFTTTPEMKAHVDVVAAVGKYSAEVAGQVEGLELHGEIDHDSQTHYEQKGDDEQENVQATEVSLSQSTPSESPDSPEDGAGESNPTSGEVTTVHQELLETRDMNPEEQNQRDADHKEQQQYIPRRQYQNQRGGGRAGGGRRGYYGNGRGGRGGRGGGGGGGYQNGRSQQYYEPGYYPRNNYNPRGRGGGRFSGGAMYNNNHAAAAAQDRHIEVGADS